MTVAIDPEENAEDRRRSAVVKARLVGMDAPLSFEGGESKLAFANTGVLLPPYDPEALLYWYEHSSSLRPNVDAMAANIDGFGFRLDPAVRLDAKDANEKVRDILFARAINAGETDPTDPTDEEVEVEKTKLRRLARAERLRLVSFFRSASHGSSFIRLRIRRRVDLETTGNAYWEVIRNRKGEVSRFKYVPSYLTRLLPLDPTTLSLPEWEQISDVDFERVEIPTNVRRYVQVEEQTGSLTYFKALNDPRTVSSKTGAVYPDATALANAEPGVRAANELIHFRIDFPSSPYGLPRWIGALPEVMGARASSEVNYLLFDNKSVPPCALLVSGGVLAEGVDVEIADYIEKNIKGRKNFHKILVIEAESDGKTGKAPRLEIVPLNAAIPNDALFQEYDERCSLKIGSQFRIARILRGETSDYNRATADAALVMTEDQVFAPERDEFDAWMNSEILPALGIRFWRFRSLTPVSRDPDRLSKNVELLMRAGAILPRDGREIATDVFNREFDPIPGDWQDRPIAFTLAGIQTGRDGDVVDAAAGDVEGPSSLDRKARDLLGVRDRLQAEEKRLAARRVELARDALAGAQSFEGEDGSVVLEIPRDQMTRWVKPATAGEE